jgi:TPR repeat protein
LDSSAGGFFAPAEEHAAPNDQVQKRGNTMNSGSRYLHSVLRLLLLAAIFGAAQSRCTAQESPQKGSASLDADISVSKLHSLAERGDAVAQYVLADSYLHNYSTNSNPTNDEVQSAVKWLRASAAQGNASAEYRLGYLYEHGQGVSRDYAKAMENYLAAAMQGHSSAENNLASLYQRGQGVPKNLGEAYEWYLRSAGHGNPVGQCNLASMYYLGNGIPRDYKEAARWFRAAADAGSAEAQNSIGVLYYKGMGVTADYAEAARWLLLAAQHGLPGAETNLAYLYEQGKGVSQDYVTAYNWYSRAFAAGDESAASRRKEIAHLMTRKQINEATSSLSEVSYQPRQPQGSPAVGAFSLLQH